MKITPAASVLMSAAALAVSALPPAFSECGSSQGQASYTYTCAAGQTTSGVAPGPSVSNGCGGGPSGGGGGSASGGTSSSGNYGEATFSVPVSGAYVPTIVPNPPSIPPTPETCQLPSTEAPSDCPRCYDEASGGVFVSGDPAVYVPNFAGPVDFRVFYLSDNQDAGDIGRSWRHSFESSVRVYPAARLLASASVAGGWSDPYSPGALMGASGMAIPASDLETVAVVRPPDGRRLLYFLNSSGQWVAPAGETAVLSVSGSTAAPSGFVWSADDRLVYSYDGAGRLVSVTDRNGAALLLEYSSGLLSAVRDPDGRVLYSFSRDGAGRVSSVTDIGGRAHYFGYTGSGLLERLEGPEGVSTFGYQGYSVSGLEGFAGGYFASGGWGSAELLSRVTAPGGQVTSYAYSAPAYRVDHSRDCKSVPAFNYAGAERCALLAGAAAPADKVYLAPLAPAASGYYFVDRAAFSAWYFPQRYYLSSKTGPRGTYTYEYIVDDQTGEGETRITPPLGGKEVVRWNKSNGHFRRAYTVDGAGGKTLFAYDSANNPVQVTGPAGNIRAYAWDAKNRLTAATDPLGNRVNIGYDPSSGNISYYADAKGNTAHFSYDGNGNLSRITDAAGHSTDITNNARGLPLAITDPLGHSVTIGRDGYGNATSVTDALNRNSAFAYDIIGRVTRMTDPAGKAAAFTYNPDNTPGTVTDAIGGVTRYGYEPGDFETGAKRLVSLTDAANHATGFAYDAQGRLASVTDPLNHAAAYGYDAAGRISAAADANGSSFAFAYDILGRLASATGPDGQTTYVYDLANNLTSIEDPQTKLQFGYDAAGRVTATSAQDKIANLGGAFTYTYDAAGNRLAMTASGYTWSYSYDALNRPVTITAPGGTQFRFTYDAAGRRTRMDMGAAVAADYVYDAANQLTGIIYRRKTDNAVIAQVGYTYDNAGNRATMADDFGSHNFGYDDLHRLTGAVHPSSGALSVQSETFAYDAVGNRTSDAVRSGYACDAANRLNSDSQYTYAYDNNGNLTTKTRASDNAQTAYIYDAQNRLTQVNLPSGYSETLRYDATGRRIAKTITHNGETIREQHYIYDGEDIAFVTGADGALKAIYTHGPGTDEPLMLKKGASDYYLLADGLGSIIAIADQTGNIAERAQYQAYGKPAFRNEVTGSTSSWSQTGSLYSYTAREWDAETGLFYYRARYYAPDIGRFIQKDPIGFNGGDTNLYAYVWNDPLIYTDPYGEFGMEDMPTLPQGFIDFSAGWGDWIWFGTGPWIRKRLDIDNVNMCSESYTAGLAAGALTDVAIGGYYGMRRGGFLNSNRYLRIGVGKDKGRYVFRIVGDFTKGKHIDIYKGPHL